MRMKGNLFIQVALLCLSTSVVLRDLLSGNFNSSTAGKCTEAASYSECFVNVPFMGFPLLNETLWKRE